MATSWNIWMSNENSVCDQSITPTLTINKAKEGLASSKVTIENIIKLRQYRSRLLDGSDEAKNLGNVIRMLDKSYRIMLKTVKKFLGLSFRTQSGIEQAKDFLFDASHGYISAKLKRARASSGIISDNYYEFLQSWFSSKLGEEEAKKIQDIFVDKIMRDDMFVYQMDLIGDYLREASREIYPLVKSNQLSEAEVKHKEFTKCLESQLDAISKEWEQLSNLEGEFRQI